MDDWREAIQWADFAELWPRPTEDARREPRRRLPLQLVSIELIRRLARQMETGELPPASFLELLPLGWFVPEYDHEVPGSDDTEHARPMVLVYGDEKADYDAFLARVAQADLTRLADPSVELSQVEGQLAAWWADSARGPSRDSRGTLMNLLHLARHVAQAGGAPPPFFPFDDREAHDLTPVAEVAAREDWGPTRTRQHLETMYLDERRFWRAMFPTFDLFVGQLRALVDGIIKRATGAGSAPMALAVIAPAPPLPEAEPSADIKREVIRRDGSRCLCCGDDRARRLQGDHILSRYHGGQNDPSNLQTLCMTCNRDKAIQEIHFRKTATLLTSAPPLRFPAGFGDSTDLADLARDVRRTINMFYQCAAVDDVELKTRGIKRREWRIRLRSGNPPAWFDGPLWDLLDQLAVAQAQDRSGTVRSLILEAPASDGGPPTTLHARLDTLGGQRSLPAAAITPRKTVTLYHPDDLDLPNEPLFAKVIRADPKQKLADLRVSIGRSERELTAVPFSAIFSPDAMRRDDDDDD